jgi:hypothetical protein
LLYFSFRPPPFIRAMHSQRDDVSSPFSTGAAHLSSSWSCACAPWLWSPCAAAIGSIAARTNVHITNRSRDEEEEAENNDRRREEEGRGAPALGAARRDDDMAARRFVLLLDSLYGLIILRRGEEAAGRGGRGRKCRDSRRGRKSTSIAKTLRLKS